MSRLEKLTGRWGDGEMGRWGDGEMGRWGNGEMGRWGDGEMGDQPLTLPRRGMWGDGEICIFAQLNVFLMNIL
ncbi:hypothetical protein [Okeania sp. KiyG1]|uniref:hypothetical protein n=1 Tax=Okeania sp. KiyG1 TaxID=2720165 RepID=UPI001923CC1A|nr:hypothetical protein [Okeania sp. KiyG1]